MLKIPFHNAVIVKGMAPVRRGDARIELKFQTEKKVGTIDQQSGAIDGVVELTQDNKLEVLKQLSSIIETVSVR